MILRPGTRSMRVAGALIGLAALGYVAAEIVRNLGGWGATPGSEGTPFVFGLFALIAVAGAVRMVTHPRPVYAALYFVLVVIASAALFLLMQAEFMAFALVIVYAGAILITYLFVLMLAQQARSEGEPDTLAEYDRVPREPATAVVVGFVMVAVLAHGLFGSRVGIDGTASPATFRSPDPVAAANAAWIELDRLPKLRDAAIREVAPGFREAIRRNGASVVARDGRGFVTIVDAEGVTRDIELPASAAPTNTQRVGLALVSQFPVSLELAGVILTMAMFGAVVLARRQAELGEDQRRVAGGIRRLTVDDGEPVERPERDAPRSGLHRATGGGPRP